jgi:type IV pilus assembly protein PilQ
MGLLSSFLLVLAIGAPAAADAPAAGATPASSSEARISVDFKDADIVDIVRLLSEVGNFQVVIDPGTSCKLTLKLKEVPWDTTLDVALRVCGLGSETDNGIVRVAPVAKLTAEHQERRKLAEEQKLNRPLRTMRYTLSYARAADLAPLIKKFLSPRGDVVFDARTNTLIITDVD